MENQFANHARLGNFKYPIIKAKLRAWLVLEDFYNNILRAADKGNREEFVSSFYSFISAALFISEKDLQSCPWYEVTRAFREIYTINRPSFDFPILHNIEHKNKDAEWDYSGRDWFNWLHLLAKEYGWDIKYIENLDLDDGIALLQEILVNEQLEKEWQWSLFEGAYSTDPTTHITKFVPLERPNWMKPIPKPAKKMKIKASELPIGLILKWNTDTNEYTRPQ